MFLCMPFNERRSLNLDHACMQARIRGLELHDPDHTDQACYSKLLSDPQFLRSSGESMQSIVDVPYNGGWKPTDFKNLSQLIIRRANAPNVPHEFDIGVTHGMAHLKVLVLSSGFNSIVNVELLPDSCCTLVVSCPGHPQESHLEMPAWPPGKSLEWLSLSAHTLQMDLELVRGHVRQLNIHTAFLFIECPAMRPHYRKRLDDRLAAAEHLLTGVVQELVEDTNLLELQLNCEVVSGGRKPMGPPGGESEPWSPPGVNQIRAPGTSTRRGECPPHLPSSLLPPPHPLRCCWAAGRRVMNSTRACLPARSRWTSMTFTPTSPIRR
jgi:hypothetical protein